MFFHEKNAIFAFDYEPKGYHTGNARSCESRTAFRCGCFSCQWCRDGSLSPGNNPNVSNYSFTAEIEDHEKRQAKLMDYKVELLQMMNWNTMPEEKN